MKEIQNNTTYIIKQLIITILLITLTLFIPYVGFIIALFIPLPIMLVTQKLDVTKSFIFLIGVLLASIFVANWFGIIIAMLFGVTGYIIGICIKYKNSNVYTFLMGTTAFLVNLTISYIIFIKIFEFNLLKVLKEYMRDTINELNTLYNQTGINISTSNMEEIYSVIYSIMPTIFLIVSVVTVLMLIFINYPLLKKYKIFTPKWTNFSLFMLPKSIFWYYIAVLLVDLFTNVPQGTFISNMVINFIMVFQFLFYLQGLSFIFYMVKEKDGNKILPYIIAIISFIVPIFMYIIRLLGIIDLGFGLRKFAHVKK